MNHFEVLCYTCTDYYMTCANSHYGNCISQRNIFGRDQKRQDSREVIKNMNSCLIVHPSLSPRNIVLSNTLYIAREYKILLYKICNINITCKLSSFLLLSRFKLSLTKLKCNTELQPDFFSTSKMKYRKN